MYDYDNPTEIRKLTLLNGNTYEGEVQHNLPHGIGKEYNHLNEIVYDGNWEMGSYHGEGLQYVNIYDVIYRKGNFNNNYPDGIITYYDFNDTQLGYIEYQDGWLKECHLRYSNGAIAQFNSFCYDRQQTLTHILCSCGEYVSEFSHSYTGFIFKASQYAFDCPNCKKHIVLGLDEIAK